MKRAFLRALALAFCIGVVGVPVYAEETAQPEVTELEIAAQDVNVTVVFSPDDTFSYDYDTSNVVLTAEQTGSTMRISVAPSAQAHSGMVTVSVPEQPYSRVQVDSVRAGLSLPAFNADLTADVNMGAFSVKIPAGFDRTMNCKIVGSSSSVAFEKGASDYTFSAKMASVAPSFPEAWPEWPWHGDYTYQDGNGTGNIHLDLENTSLSIITE